MKLFLCQKLMQTAAKIGTNAYALSRAFDQENLELARITLDVMAHDADLLQSQVYNTRLAMLVMLREKRNAEHAENAEGKTNG